MQSKQKLNKWNKERIHFLDVMIDNGLPWVLHSFVLPYVISYEHIKIKVCVSSFIVWMLELSVKRKSIV